MDKAVRWIVCFLSFGRNRHTEEDTKVRLLVS